MKNLIQIILPVVTIAIAIGTSCSKTNAEDLTPVVAVEDTVAICAPAGLYETEVKPIIDTHCVSCHAPSKSIAFIPLDTYADLKSNSANLMASINRDGTVDPMPAGGADKLSDCDIQTIQEWVDGGMQEN